MSEEDIALDTEEAAKVAAQWREYAELVQAHGSSPHVPIDQLGPAVGDLYADYVDAKAGEYAERHAAYDRVAAHARLHADKLERTRQGLESVDAESAARINSIATD